MRILFTGGGTLGPVTPLLAVAEELKRISELEISELAKNKKTNSLIRQSTNPLHLVWIGTRRGPERKLVEEAGIKFSWLYAPKWRRYFDVRNVFVPLALHIATKIAWFKLLRLRPDVIVTAGGFVGVPVVWAAWWLRRPVLLHNQDVRWSLANKLVAPFVRRITYALPGTVPKRWQKKAVWTGNPVREFVLKGSRERGLRLCGFTEKLPTIMVLGGGTGAKRLNEIVVAALLELTKKFQVIHVTGRGKAPSPDLASAQSPSPLGRGEGEGRYCSFEFVTSEMGDLLAAADLVITRAGMGVLSELAALGKPMIIVPIPGSHQEENAEYFAKHGAAVVMNQSTLTSTNFVATISRLFEERGMLDILNKHAKGLFKPNATKRVAEAVQGLAKK